MWSLAGDEPSRGDDGGEVFERVDRVSLDELVDVGQRRGHAACERRVVGRGLQRVHPHDAVRDAVQAGHLLGELGGLAAIPAVGEDDDHRAAGHAPHAPLVVERAQALAEAGAARPVDDALRRRGDRGVGIARRELTGDAGEAGAEREGLDPAAPDHRGVQEAHERAGVGLHRAADVAEQDDAPGPARVLRVRATDRFAAGAHRLTDGAAQIGTAAAPARGAHATRLAQRAGEAQVGHQTAGLGELGVGVVGEVAGLEHLVAAVAHLDAGVDLLVAVAGAVVVGAVVERQRDLLHLGPGEAQGADALPPRGERAVVGVEVFGAMHERGQARPVDALAPFAADRRQRVGEQHRAADGHGEPGAAQHPGEAHGEAIEARRLRGADRRRPWPQSPRRPTAPRTSASTPWARVRSWSSRYLRMVPSVSDTVASSTSPCPSAASAFAQSMVSATPGGL